MRFSIQDPEYVRMTMEWAREAKEAESKSGNGSYTKNVKPNY